MSITSIFSFLTKPFRPAAVVAPVAASKYNIKPRRALRKPKNAWLDREMDAITDSGQYIVVTPNDIDFAHAKTLLNARLEHRFGAGNYSTKQIKAARSIRVTVK